MNAMKGHRAERQTPDNFKREVTKSVREVQKSGRARDLGPASEKLHYQVLPLTLVPTDVTDTAVPVSADEVRKNFFAIRSLLRVEEGIAFAIVVEGQPAAILRRHPRYNPEEPRGYLKLWRQKRELAAVPEMHERLARIEALLQTVAEAIGSQSPDRRGSKRNPS
jgi:hypothetical protein